MRAVHQDLTVYPNLPPEYRGLQLMQKWVSLMDSKKATDALSEEEVRELKYDLQQAYDQFRTLVLKSWVTKWRLKLFSNFLH